MVLLLWERNLNFRAADREGYGVQKPVVMCVCTCVTSLLCRCIIYMCTHTAEQTITAESAIIYGHSTVTVKAP